MGMMESHSEPAKRLSRGSGAGFTLVELLVVVGLIMVATAIAFPMITTAMPKYRLRAAARELVINFRKAKLEAVRRNRNAIFLFTPETAADEGGVYRIYIDTNANNALDAGEVLITYAMPRGTVLYASNFNNAVYGVNAGGYTARGVTHGALAGTGSVEMRTSTRNRYYKASLSTSGNVSLETKASSGAAWGKY